MKVREGIWVQVDGRAIKQAALVVCRNYVYLHTSGSYMLMLDRISLP